MPDMDSRLFDRRTFLAGIAVAGVLAPASDLFVSQADAAFGPRVSVASFNQNEAEAYISRVRAQHGAGPVRMESRLVDAARRHSLMMAQKGKMAHQFGPGTRFTRRIKQAGSFGAAAENVGAGYPTVEAVVEGWLRSSGHRRNLLNRGLTHIGLAGAVNPATRYRTYWTLILARPYYG